MSRGDGPSGPAAEVPRSGPMLYRVLGEYSTHLEAGRVVDKLSDQGFPVEHVRIIGIELRPEENVTGRMSKGRSVLGTSGSRVSFGLLIGLILGLFAPEGGWFVIVLICVLIGGFLSLYFEVVAHIATRGGPGPSNVERLQASYYAVEVDSGRAEEAARLVSGA